MQYLDTYEDNLKKSIQTYLKANEELDDMLPDAPDIEEKWEPIANAYLQDGVREFNNYPTVSLGWMMYVGMATAQMWDEDWEHYSKVEDLYSTLRNPRGYDCMDEYIGEEVLKLDADGLKRTEKLVSDSATITLRSIRHEAFEPGSPLAFHAYVRSLHQMYLMGAAMQLHRMGYHMVKM